MSSFNASRPVSIMSTRSANGSSNTTATVSFDPAVTTWDMTLPNSSSEDFEEGPGMNIIRKNSKSRVVLSRYARRRQQFPLPPPPIPPRSGARSCSETECDTSKSHLYSPQFTSSLESKPTIAPSSLNSPDILSVRNSLSESILSSLPSNSSSSSIDDLVPSSTDDLLSSPTADSNSTCSFATASNGNSALHTLSQLPIEPAISLASPQQLPAFPAQFHGSSSSRVSRFFTNTSTKVPDIYSAVPKTTLKSSGTIGDYNKQYPPGSVDFSDTAASDSDYTTFTSLVTSVPPLKELNFNQAYIPYSISSSSKLAFTKQSSEISKTLFNLPLPSAPHTRSSSYPDLSTSIQPTLVLASSVIPIAPTPQRLKAHSADDLQLLKNAGGTFACKELIIMEEKLKEMKTRSASELYQYNLSEGDTNRFSLTSISNIALTSPHKFVPSRQPEPSPPRSEEIIIKSPTKSRSSELDMPTLKPEPSLTNIQPTNAPTQSKRFSFLRRKKKSNAPSETSMEHTVEQLPTVISPVPERATKAFNNELFTTAPSGPNYYSGIPPARVGSTKSLSDELDIEVERASLSAQQALLNSKVRSQAMEPQMPTTTLGASESGLPALTGSETSLQPSLDIRDNKHGFSSHRLLRSSSSSLVMNPPPALLPTIQASPNSSHEASEKPPSSMRTHTNHSRSQSAVSNLTQNRFSIATSLARNSLISQYSPIIERATEVALAKPRSTSPGLENAAATSIVADAAPKKSALSGLQSSSSSTSLSTSLSIDKIRESTHELKSILYDMKALRQASGSSETSPSLSPPLVSPSAAARPGPSRSTPLPSIATLPSSPHVVIESQTSSLTNLGRGSHTSMDAVSVSRIAPPGQLGSPDSLAALQSERESKGNMVYVPTVTGSGTVPRASSSGNLDKELPLSSVSLPKGPAQTSQLQGQAHARSDSVPTTAYEVGLKQGAFPDIVDTHPTNVPKFPIPTLPQKSVLRNQQHSRSTSLPVRFAELPDVIEHIAVSASETTDSETIGSAGLNRSPNSGSSEDEKVSLDTQPSLEATSGGFSFPIRGSGEQGGDGKTDLSFQPFKPATVSQLPINRNLYLTSRSASAPIADLEDLPTPPFIIHKRQDTDSSTESYVTAHSQTDSSDNISYKAIDDIPLYSKIGHTPEINPNHQSFVPSTLPLSVHGANNKTRHVTSKPPQDEDSSIPSPVPTTPIRSIRPSTFTSGSEPFELSPSTVIASRQKVSSFKAKTGPLSLSTHKRTISSPLLSHMPPAPSSTSGSSLRNSVISLSQAGEPGAGIKQGTSDEGLKDVKQQRTSADHINNYHTQKKSAEPLTPVSGVKESETESTVIPETVDVVAPVSRTNSKKSRDFSSSTVRPSPPKTEGEEQRHHHGRSKHRHSHDRHHRATKSTAYIEEDEDTKVPETLEVPKSSSGRSSKRYSKNRPFSNAGIQKLMELSDTTFKLEDVDMPPTERQLVEKFVNALAKLSADMSDDRNKRPEGIRRLHNALRAIEGWI